MLMLDHALPGIPGGPGGPGGPMMPLYSDPGTPRKSKGVSHGLGQGALPSIPNHLDRCLLLSLTLE